MAISRRSFLTLLAVPAILKHRPSVAITMDDGRWQSIPEERRADAEERLLSSLGRTPAFLFPIGDVVDNPHGADLLARWNSAGHLIGNHTYSHTTLTRTPPEEFEAGILRAEAVLSKYSGFRKWFRFPVLKEGQTIEVRDHVRSFLALHGYRNAAVTIDTSDWYYNQRLLERIKLDPGFDVGRFRQPYLDHIADRANYYDRLSRDLLGRSVAHTILVHYNLLNALFLGDVLPMFRSKGWQVVGAEEAFSDPVFKRLPDTLPAGESRLWALAKQSGKFESRLRYPGEDGVYEKPLLDRLGL